MYTIYFQTKEGDYLDDFVYYAYLEFKERNAKIAFFENIEYVPVSKFNIIIGSVESTVAYFKKLGVQVPKSLNVPIELRDFVNRNVYDTTLGEVRNLDDNKFPLFIKAYEKTNDFIAGPIKNKIYLGYYTHKFEDNLPVQISNIVEFMSEYRCFVNDGKLVGLKHYINDFTLFPNIDFIKEVIKQYKNAPIAYTLDVGITKSGTTELIECNDAWSIGNYGLNPKIYVTMLLNRWFEILKTC